ncbi:unnamed protein product [Rotaria socialis]|uniref:Uncharacterized protein n=1 Tax=Rotaria socialis TaxID=392032 RepID=A0A817U071_9BILA|nr:unnamed protein product [Rotaria socialis]CAF3324217.1 unnamed protein product [Rotaria socialis]CAF3431277.1 unnamed protein product [Rotaria socialis]CAF3612500.1 unnamed protein product [Rotaria socialis]CAF3754425.1 unnamed protein product [Rotaria socialis]
MNSGTQYRSVPTTKITNTKNSYRTQSTYFIGIAILCIAFGIPLIIYGAFEYKIFNNFSTQPSYCRVNGIETQRQIRKILSRVDPIWNVDIIKQPQSSNSAKDLLILRSNLKIIGPEGHVFASSALEEAGRLYSIGKVYPCYHHKQLLHNAVDTREINLKYNIQWEKPSPKIAFVLFAIASALIISGIIALSIGASLHCRC